MRLPRCGAGVSVTLRERWLPLRPRPLILMMPVLLGGALVVLVAPAAFVYIGGGSTAPRAFGPLEYVPMVLALALSACLAPRFPDWDRYGAPVTRRLAVAALVAVLLVPLGAFLLVLALPLEVHRAFDVPIGLLLPFASNIAVAALLASILHGVAGRLVGTLAWMSAVYGLLYWQAEVPTRSDLLPFTMSFTRDGGLDSGVRWVWIAALLVVAAGIAVVRRGVPIRITLRVDSG